MTVRLCRSFCAGLVKTITGAGVIWHGCPPESAKPRVYFANHGSHLDFVTIWAALPPSLRKVTRPVAARDFWDAGSLRRWISRDVFRALLINREGVTRFDNPLRDMTRVIEGGESLIIFPEGTRSRTGETGNFKAGLYHLMKACQDRAEFVPVYLQNLNRVLPKGEILPIPVLTSVVFGAPLAPPDEDESKADFLTRARDAVLALKDWDKKTA